MMFFTCMVQIYSSLSWTNFLSVPYANFSTYMVHISSTLSRNKLSFVPYMMFFTCMVQICSSLSWTNFLSVPYANFSTYMVQISSTLESKQAFICTICKFFLLYGTDLFLPRAGTSSHLYHMRIFSLVWYRFYSSPSWNKLSYVPYTNFSSYMVHISSALSWTSSLSVPYMKFFAYMVQISSALELDKLSICTIYEIFRVYGTDFF